MGLFGKKKHDPILAGEGWVEDYGQKKDGRTVFKIYKLSEVDQVAEVLDFVVKGNIAIVNYSPLKFRNEFELKYAVSKFKRGIEGRGDIAALKGNYLVITGRGAVIARNPKTP